MNKKILYYGLVAGLISSSLFIGLMLLGKASMEHFEHGAIYGYTLMILAFSLTYVCIRDIRDKERGGQMTFGQAFLIGLGVTLIASTIYVGVWMIDLHFFNPDFAAKYGAQAVQNLKTSGASEAQIAKATQDMARFTEMYKNPVVVALLTYLEIVPIGLLVSLLCAWILKRKVA